MGDYCSPLGAKSELSVFLAKCERRATTTAAHHKAASAIAGNQNAIPILDKFLPIEASNRSSQWG